MRRWPRLLIAGAVVGLLGLYPLLAPPAHRIDEAHLALVQNGMTLAEVESIFGQPPGEYDWAVADDLGVGLWDVATGLKLRVKQSSGLQQLVGAETSWVELAARGSAQRSQRIAITFLGTRWSSDSRTWVSRHGACRIWFDPDGRVTGKSDWHTSHVEPPWNQWWKRCFGD